MNFVSIKLTYWIAFAIAVIILPLNIGIGLIALALFIIPILFLHIIAGLKLNKIRNHWGLILFSSINLLCFALIRPDGAHTVTDNGLSSALNVFGIHAGFNRNYEDHYFFVSLLLLLIQLIIEIKIRKLRKNSLG